MSTDHCIGVGHGKVCHSRGFSTVELVIVMLLLLGIASMAIPSYTSITRYLHIAGDMRDLQGLTAQAKMRAAQDFTHARVRANLAGERAARNAAIASWPWRFSAPP